MMTMSFPFLEDSKKWWSPVLRYIQPVWIWSVVCFLMLTCALFVPTSYAGRYERACDTANVLGL